MALKHQFLIQTMMTGDTEMTKELTEKQLLAYIAKNYAGQNRGEDVRVYLLTPWPLELDAIIEHEIASNKLNMKKNLAWVKRKGAKP